MNRRTLVYCGDFDNIKNTGKIFLHSGLTGLYGTAKQQEDQIKEVEV